MRSGSSDDGGARSSGRTANGFCNSGARNAGDGASSGGDEGGRAEEERTEQAGEGGIAGIERRIAQRPWHVSKAVADDSSHRRSQRRRGLFTERRVASSHSEMADTLAFKVSFGGC